MIKEDTSIQFFNAFLKLREIKNFVKFLNGDRRRTFLLTKIIVVFLKHQHKRLSFNDILKESNVGITALKKTLKRLKKMQIISDYEMINIMKKKIEAEAEFTTRDTLEWLCYRNKYKLVDNKRTMLLLMIIWTFNQIKLKNKRNNP